ncbi:hypothetical protein ACQKLP_15040 [Chitinophaga sp. NPDC101104]|uniref:hypothetical protein n=1 Tax=Chitinophaga sp. NPDC101104 TaxID=3390561 RepID=UPI003CFEB7D7
MRTVLIPILCAAMLAGCHKDKFRAGDGNAPPPDDNGPAVVTAKGEPDGSAPAQKSIGAAGGTLASVDGQLTLTVPAGAFAADQNVSIQRISNRNPSAAGPAYRLLPEGVTFARPISITFRYRDSDTTFFAPEYLAGSYQKTSGTWAILPGTVDAQARTVTVQTTHFSDWSVVGGIELKIKQPALAAQGTTGLSVTVNKNMMKGEGKDEVELYLPTLLPSSQIRQWKIENGPGRLLFNRGDDNPMEYEAPANVPKPPKDLITIAVTLQPDPADPKTITLRGKIRIVEGAMLLKVNDGDDIELFAYPAVKDEFGMWTVQGRSKDFKTSVVIHWPRGRGNHVFSTDPLKNNPHFSAIYNDASYGYLYLTDDGTFASPGGVNVTSMGELDGYVKGEFTVNKAGLSSNMRRTVKITGSFMTPMY